ncbi:MAG: LysM peptidoglycan-binding domain-containing protein [Candidatus Scalindua sp.]|nr:LysM peptidoglycan-binding domain-containing protein [Candidatus Scalindua sp.]
MKNEKQIGLVLCIATFAIVGVLHVMRESENEQIVEMLNQTAFTENFIEESQIIQDFRTDTGIELPIQFEIRESDEWKRFETVCIKKDDNIGTRETVNGLEEFHKETTTGEEGMNEISVVTRKEIIHMVSSQDSLSDLSRKYYGDANRWKKIYEANKNIIEDPDTLKVGDKLLIPDSI